MGSMQVIDAMVGSTRGACAQQPKQSANFNCFPPHPPPPAPSPPKCPPCFAMEPAIATDQPPPAPAAQEAAGAAARKTEDHPWCNCWNWSSCDCWQWCNGWQWKSYQQSWKGYERSSKSYRSQTWYEWQHSKKNNNNSNWYSWRSWTGSEPWDYNYGGAGGGNSNSSRQDRRRSSCCGCWQRRRTTSGNGSRHSRSAEARLHCAFSDYSDLLFRDITPEDYELLLQLDESNERPTASKSSVDSLPHAQAKEVVGQVCTVCLEPFCLNDTVSKLPRCEHLFHKDCVAKWLLERHRSCPLCSTEVFPAKS